MPLARSRIRLACAAGVLVAAIAVAGCGSGEAPEAAGAPPAQPGSEEPLAARLSPACVAELNEAGGADVFARVASRCLAGIADWAAAVARIERGFAEPAAAAAAISPPPIRCSSPRAWKEAERTHVGDAGLVLAGYVDADDPTVHLAPATCLALEGLLDEPAVPCLVDLRTACEPGSIEAAFALATIAHEAQHVAGVGDEAEAECYAIQRVDDVALAAGLPAEQAAAIGPFVRHATVHPPAYESAECRPGGALDLEPETPAFP